MANQIEVKDRRGKRVYVIDGEEYDSVTSILSIIDKSGPLIPWAVKATCDYIDGRIKGGEGVLVGAELVKGIILQARKEATRQKEEAADIGSIVHHAIHEFVKTGRTPSFDDERATRAWEAFTKWSLSVGFKPFISEKVVYNVQHRFAGTLDLIAELDIPDKKGKMRRKLYIIDVKSSKGFYEEQFGPQVAAYDMCYENRFDGIGILRLDKATGTPHFHDCTEKRGDYRKLFLSANALYKQIRELKKGDKNA